MLLLAQIAAGLDSLPQIKKAACLTAKSLKQKWSPDDFKKQLKNSNLSEAEIKRILDALIAKKKRTTSKDY